MDVISRRSCWAARALMLSLYMILTATVSPVRTSTPSFTLANIRFVRTEQTRQADTRDYNITPCSSLPLSRGSLLTNEYATLDKDKIPRHSCENSPITVRNKTQEARTINVAVRPVGKPTELPLRYVVGYLQKERDAQQPALAFST